MQRVLGHVPQRISLTRRQRIADARLNIAPPAVIGAAKPHQVRSPRVIAGKPHRLHDRLGPRHMEGDFIEAGNLFQQLDVLGNQRMIRAEHRAKLAHPRRAALDGLFIEVIAEEVHAVGTGDIVEAIAVEVSDGDAGARLHERRGGQMRAHIAAVLERYPIGVGELQIGNTGRRLGGAPDGLGKARLVKRRKPFEPGAAALRNFRRRAVRTEESRFIVFIERHESRKPPRDPRVTGQRRCFACESSKRRRSFSSEVAIAAPPTP